jgi:hypothetical protein
MSLAVVCAGGEFHRILFLYLKLSMSHTDYGHTHYGSPNQGIGLAGEWKNADLATSSKLKSPATK